MARRNKTLFADYDAEFPDDVAVDEEDSGSSDGRKRGLYVRFDQIHEKHTGPMRGPFDSIHVNRSLLVGKRGEKLTNIAEWRGERWFLCAVTEPGYLSFSVVFS